MKPNEIQFAHNLQALSAPQCRRIVEALLQDSLSLALKALQTHACIH